MLTYAAKVNRRISEIRSLIPEIRDRVLGEAYSKKKKKGSIAVDLWQALQERRDKAWAEFVKEREQKRRQPSHLRPLWENLLWLQEEKEPEPERWSCAVHGPSCVIPAPSAAELSLQSSEEVLRFKIR